MQIICANIIQNHASASDLICICLDFYLNKIEIENLNWSWYNMYIEKLSL